MNRTGQKQLNAAQADQHDSVRFSRHADERLRRRGLQISTSMRVQLITAIDTLAGKGGRSALVMFDQLILLVSVSKRTVITVMGRESLNKNVFTDIDSVIFISA